MRYLVGFLLTLVLLVVAIILIFHHGGNSGKVPQTQAPLTSYANDPTSAVRLTVDGPITAPQTHSQVRITVDDSNATFELVNGYNGEVVRTSQTPETSESYAVFLHALQHAGYTLGNTASDLKDERGYCPAGNRYIFEVTKGGDDIQRFWATNCNGTPKSFRGNTNTVLDLFKAQVPNYNNLIGNANLGGVF